jgi:hypothetical protein
MQDQGQGLQPIAYMAKRLTSSEAKYSSHDQELLAVIVAIRVLQALSYGCAKFTVALIMLPASTV